MPTVTHGRLPQGYGTPEPDRLLSWEHCRERLEQAKHFWVCTASHDGAPHARPLWGAWVDDNFYFDGAITTRWGRNLSANPHVEIHLESGGEVVIIEGEFTLTNDLTQEAFERVQASYKARYESYQPETREQLYQIRPRKALAWTEFPKDVTRFRFDK